MVCAVVFGQVVMDKCFFFYDPFLAFLFPYSVCFDAIVSCFYFIFWLCNQTLAIFFVLLYVLLLFVVVLFWS